MANLAYYYAAEQRSEYKAKAKELARKTYEMRPGPSKLDTLGYVLLRFAEGGKDLEEARDCFKKALEGAGPDRMYVEEHIKELEKVWSRTDI